MLNCGVIIVQEDIIIKLKKIKKCSLEHVQCQMDLEGSVQFEEDEILLKERSRKGVWEGKRPVGSRYKSMQVKITWYERQMLVVRKLDLRVHTQE